MLTSAVRTSVEAPGFTTSDAASEPVDTHGSPIGSEDLDSTPPSHAVDIAPRWNESKTMIWRVTATCYCAFVMGANDAAYGAIIPYVCISISVDPI